MNFRASCVLSLAITTCLCAAPLDRIAVTVGKYVISEQDILQDIRISAFLDARPVGDATFDGAEKRKAAERLIDQYLVLQDAAATRASLTSPNDAGALLAPIRARYSSDPQYRAALAQAGIAEVDLSNHLLAGLKMLRYTDLRFRPEVQLSETAVREFYDKLGAKDTAGRSFEESRGQIEKLLTDRQVMESLDRWLAMTRHDTRIVYRDIVFRDAIPQGAVSP
jgi:hypothetical protein